MKISDLTTPKDLCISTDTESDIMVEKFEKELKKQEKGQLFYYVIIKGMHSNEACAIIVNAYKQVGWKNVECLVHDKLGATTLRLSMN